MGKKVKIVLAAVGVLIALMGLGVAAAFFAPGVTLKTDAENITGVSQYFVLKDGSLYNVRFSLVDANNAFVTSDAHVDLVVKMEDGKQIYSRSFDIKAEDFQTYQLVMTGAPIVAYAWQIDGSELKHDDLDFPKAYLTITLPNGKTFEADNLVF